MDRKLEILQSLAAELETQPGARVTTAKLARSVGVSEAALYRHFASKQELATAEDGGQGYRAFLLQRWTQPLVSSQLIRIAHEYEDLLTESLARDFGIPADGVSTPRLVATMLWGVNAYVQRLHATQEEFDLVKELVGAIDAVEAQFGQLIRN